MGKIVKVSGPLVVATGLEEANMADVVRVGEQRLIGEILTMNSGNKCLATCDVLNLTHQFRCLEIRQFLIQLFNLLL